MFDPLGVVLLIVRGVTGQKSAGLRIGGAASVLLCMAPNLLMSVNF